MVTVRRASAADLDEILEIDSRARAGDAERSADLTRAIVDGGCVVAVGDGRVVGYVMTKPRHFYGRDFVELLVVDERTRRRGVGRILLNSAVDAAATSTVFTSTNLSNAPMRALLEVEGWEFSGRLDGLDEGDPELVFFLGR